MNRLLPIQDWLRRASRARTEAHRILAEHERAVSRVVILEDLLARLSGLPLDVQDYFREAVWCLEKNLLRAAVVMGWAGHFHVLVESVYHKHELDIRTARPKWEFGDLAELKENYPEGQLLDVAREVKFITRTQLRVLHGQLSTRNQCAHPTLYRPSLNSAIGYVDDMLRQTMGYIGAPTAHWTGRARKS